MIYGYIRVSSDKQTVENQRFEINNFCSRESMKIDGWIEETISGTKSYSKRELGKLLNRVQKDDLIICAELSRLGRNLFMIMEILNICMTKECRVWTIKDNYRLGEDILKKNNLDPKTDLSIDQSIDFGSTAAAFSGGQGDYTVEFEPSATVLEQEGSIRNVAGVNTE